MAGVSLAQRVRDLMMRPLFGPDVFISYSRRNRPYVEKLAARLHEKHERLTIITDRKTSRPAETMHPDLTALARTSSMMVVVLTRDSLASDHVKNEILTFRARDRALVPINVGEAVEKHWHWTEEGLLGYVRSPGLQDEDEEALGNVDDKKPATPSESTVQAIIDAIDFRLQTDRIRWMAGAALALLVTVALASWYLINEAKKTRDTALQQAKEAIVERDGARKAAADATIAETAAEIAEANARNEAIKQTALADQETARAAKAQAAADAADILAKHRQQTAQGLRMAADSVNVLRQSPYLVDTAVRLAVEATNRLNRIGERSVVADIALRDALDVLPEIKRERPLPKKTSAIAVSPDGRFVASATESGIELCPTYVDDCHTIPFDRHGLPDPDLLAFSANGAVLVAGHGSGERGDVHVYSGDGDSRIEAKSRPTILALSRDGRGVAFATERGITARTPSGAIRHFAADSPDSLEWSSDDEHLVMTAGGRTIVWSSKTDVPTDLPTERAKAATFSPDGNSVATIQGTPPDPRGAFEPLLLWKWRTKERKVIGDAVPPLRGVTFSPDGTRLAVAEEHTGVHVYPIQNGRDLLLPGDAGQFAFSPDGSQVAVTENHRTSRLWKLSDPPRELARSMDDFSNPAIAMREDGAVITASRSDAMRVWHAREWLETRHELGQKGPIAAIARDPLDGSLAVIFRELAKTERIGADGSVRECSALGGATALAFRGDGALLVARRGKLQWMRNWCSGAPTALPGAPVRPPGRVFALASSRDGTVVAVGGEIEAEVYRNGKNIGAFGHGQAVHSLAIDSSGRYLAVAQVSERPRKDIRQQPYNVSIWDLERPSKAGPINTITRAFPITAMAFDDSGNVLAVGAGNTVHLYDQWRIGLPREIARPNLGSPVSGVAFSIDGATLAAVGNHGEMLVTRWNPRDLVRIACDAVKTPWREAEWRAYNADVPFKPACAR